MLEFLAKKMENAHRKGFCAWISPEHLSEWNTFGLLHLMARRHPISSDRPAITTRIGSPEERDPRSQVSASQVTSGDKSPDLAKYISSARRQPDRRLRSAFRPIRCLPKPICESGILHNPLFFFFFCSHILGTNVTVLRDHTRRYKSVNNTKQGRVFLTRIYGSLDCWKETFVLQYKKDL